MGLLVVCWGWDVCLLKGISPFLSENHGESEETAGDAGGLAAEGSWRDETWPAGPRSHGDAWTKDGKESSSNN